MPDNWAALIRTAAPALAQLNSPLYRKDTDAPEMGAAPSRPQAPVQPMVSEADRMKQMQFQQLQQTAQQMPQALQGQLDLKNHTGLPDDPTSMIVRLMAQLHRKGGIPRTPDQMMPATPTY